MNDRSSPDFHVWFGGSSTGNPGLSGYAAVVIDGRTGFEHAVVSGGSDGTSLPEMLLAGAIAGLIRTPVGSSVTVHTFSDTMIHAMETGGHAPTAHEGWGRLIRESSLRRLSWVRIDDTATPEIADRLSRLALEAARSMG